MGKYLSYDIEILNEFPDGEQPDLTQTIPSVAAICTTFDDVQYFEGDPHLTRERAQRLVEIISEYHDNGYTTFGWNTLAFDFPLLAYFSGLVDQCGKLALNHIDGMFLVVVHKGYFLSLEKALIGAGLETKLHEVILNDNTMFSQMDGSKAPLLWRNKEFSAVKQYLKYDVIQPLKLAQHIERTKTIKWTSNKNKLQSFKTEMLTVKEALKLPEVDTSWMSDPKPRSDFYKWIPEAVLKAEGVL